MNVRREEVQIPWEVHPVWRGVGCVLFIAIPVMAFAGSGLIVDFFFQEYPLPYELRATKVIAGQVVTYFWTKVGLSTIVTVGGFTAIATLYAVMYRMSGSTQRGPLDSPPIRRRRRRKFKSKR